MRYIDINQSRLSNIIATLKAAHTKISKQGRLGIEDGKCCNHLVVAGESIGCLVGCLIGPENFPIGDTTTAGNLKEDKLAMAFRNAAGGYWTHLSVEDRESYQCLLSALQSLHDTSHSFGFGGTELVLFVLRVLINRMEDITHRINSQNEVEFIDFSLTVGNKDGESLNSLYRRITQVIDVFIVKK